MIFPNVHTNFIYDLFCDTVILLSEDKEWAGETLPEMDTKAFDLYGFDKVLEFAKDFHCTYDVAPSIEDYLISDSVEIRDIAETLEGRHITTERAEEVKSAIRCWDSYRSLISIWNLIGDNILPGVENDVKLDTIIDKVKAKAESIQHTRKISPRVEDEWI